jgi:hypothetical protein
MFKLKPLDEIPVPNSALQPDLFGHCDEHEAVELTRLATAVLSKSPDDLAAIAACNGLIRTRWLEAFARQKAAAEEDARFWSAAMAYLATATTATLSDPVN